MIIDYHAQYFAHELTKRCAADSVEKLSAAVAGAQVDLNPHQVDAALFAFASPLSKGALLADEVDLGKTIEAGLVISQLNEKPFGRPLVALAWPSHPQFLPLLSESANPALMGVGSHARGGWQLHCAKRSDTLSGPAGLSRDHAATSTPAKRLPNSDDFAEPSRAAKRFQ